MVKSLEQQAKETSIKLGSNHLVLILDDYPMGVKTRTIVVRPNINATTWNKSLGIWRNGDQLK